MRDFFEQLIEYFSDLWDELKPILKCMWRFLSNRTFNTLITISITIVASYFSLQAARQANETSKSSLKISEISQRFAKIADARQQRENSAEIFAKLEKRKCFKTSSDNIECHYFFTLTNAGKYTAEQFVSALGPNSYELTIDNLSGDLPAGQLSTYVTSSSGSIGSMLSPSTLYDQVVLSVAYRDKTLGTCSVKSWAFHSVPQAVSSDEVQYVGAKDENNAVGNIAVLALQRLKSNLGELECKQIPN